MQKADRLARLWALTGTIWAVIFALRVMRICSPKAFDKILGWISDVDDMQADFKPEHAPDRCYVMSQMIADTEDELHVMADKIGVARK
jgi:Protein of unknown function (DUF4031)